MSTLAGDAARLPVASSALLVGALGALAIGSVTTFPLTEVGSVAIVGVTLSLAHRWLLRWDVLTGILIAIILLIPIRRFVLPGNLGFQLEPYRLFVALVVLAWISSLLIDPRVRVRPSGLERPLWLFVAAALASVLFNIGSLGTGAQVFDTATRTASAASLVPNVVKAFTFFASFLLVFYALVSLIRNWRQVDALIKLMVGCGIAIAVLSMIESRTGFNAFDHAPRVLPFLEVNFLEEVPNRGARLRARGPAEHAIALSAALAMLVPLAVYLAVTTRRLRWWIATCVLVVGSLAAVSRTGVIMLLVIGLVFLIARFHEVKRFWPVLLPAIVLVHFAIPGTLGTLKQSFAPTALLEEQRYESGDQPGGGRLADIGPTLDQWWEKPLVGQGFGTRITTYDPGTGQVPNAFILDNQWLATLLETGVVGVIALAWLILRLVRRMLRDGRADLSARGWLLVAISASVLSLAVGMFVFDALSFVQVAFLLFILMALGVVTLQLGSRSDTEPLDAGARA